ncbi:hypothetical protein JMJ55_27755 [Belnapia sp. T6]|uniref:N-acetyltransferase domain-containing protein n=1 Tax=Belnapia mucosa TaxID=2804532 RepID=A0ABS1VEH6_9PROT|nr:hypothetical protein [Belnapia mucosa]MBL6459124.1 hypothetical protein [Belnapia mucosa]
MMHLTAGTKLGSSELDQMPSSFGGWRDDVAIRSAANGTDALRDYAERLGVQLTVHDGPTAIDLDWLWRRPLAPRGAGAAVLRAVCGYADRTGRPVRLIVLAGRGRLLGYYTQFGFEVVSSAEDDTSSTELVRTPTKRGAPRPGLAGAALLHGF